MLVYAYRVGALMVRVITPKSVINFMARKVKYASRKTRTVGKNKGCANLVHTAERFTYKLGFFGLESLSLIVEALSGS